MTSVLATGIDGRWHPGIGDPTFIGWFTVFVYLTAAALALRASRQLRKAASLNTNPGADRICARIWLALFVLLIFLGINKQLDLQTWFTERMRMLAHEGGFYEQRRRYQKLFIITVTVLGLGGVALTAFILRPILPRIWLVLSGTTLLIIFVLIRAASFHGVDALLFRGPVSLNAALELGALALIVAASLVAARPATIPRASR